MKTATLLLLPLLLVGCQVMDPPQGYVDRGADLTNLVKAVSPEDCRLTLRRITNDENGDIAFWSAAVKNHLTRSKGYRFLADRECRTNTGLAGKELLFQTGREQQTSLYLVALFRKEGLLSGDHLLIAEAGGPQATLRRDLPAIRRALETIR